MFQLSHVRLLVDDYPACFRFYRDVLGFAPGFGDEHSDYADFDTGAGQLALFSRREMAAGIGAAPDVSGARPDRVSLIFAVAGVDAAYQHLLAHGVPIVAPPTDHADWGIRTVHFRDPDGNLLEANQALRA